MSSGEAYAIESDNLRLFAAFLKEAENAVTISEEIAKEATSAIGPHPHHATLERWVMVFHGSATEDIPRSSLHGALRNASEEASRHGADALADELDELLRQVDLWPMTSG